jgi:hypothetical protein
MALGTTRGGAVDDGITGRTSILTIVQSLPLVSFNTPLTLAKEILSNISVSSCKLKKQAATSPI